MPAFCLFNKYCNSDCVLPVHRCGIKLAGTTVEWQHYLFKAVMQMNNVNYKKKKKEIVFFMSNYWCGHTSEENRFRLCQLVCSNSFHCLKGKVHNDKVILQNAALNTLWMSQTLFQLSLTPVGLMFSLFSFDILSRWKRFMHLIFIEVMDDCIGCAFIFFDCISFDPMNGKVVTWVFSDRVLARWTR